MKIDPATGQVLANGFGAGVGYVVIDAGAVTGVYDVFDIAINPASGELFGTTGSRLVVIDKTTGAVTDRGAHGINGMEGLTFGRNGLMYASTGNTGTNPDRLWTVDVATGAATLVSAMPASYHDYDALECATGASNSITGTVFGDLDNDGVYDPETARSARAASPCASTSTTTTTGWSTPATRWCSRRSPRATAATASRSPAATS